MKKIFAYILIAGLTLGFTSCDKFFDDMEGDLSKVAAEDLLNSENGLLALLADLYGNLPGISLSDNDKYQMFGAGARDLPSYGNTVSGFWNYKAVRAVNVFLKAVEDCRANGVLDDAAADKYKGEALFIRAYYYFGSVRVYGGVPIVEEDLSGYYGVDDSKLYVPRSTEKETWDWVIDQFEQAAELLPPTQNQEMRANKYSAYGMAARAALWAASVSQYWDRVALNPAYEAVQLKLSYMEKSYANAYYQKAIDNAAKVISDDSGYKLYGANPSDIKSAISNLTDLFQSWKGEEGLFGRSYKTGGDDSNGADKWVPNQWASGYTGTGAAGYAVTLNLADEYDYYSDENSRTRKDGKIKTLVNGNEDEYLNDPEIEFTADQVASYKHYNTVDEPFLLKDARFQAWVIYPGAEFRGGICYAQGGMVKPDGTVEVYPNAQSNGKGNYSYFVPGANENDPEQKDTVWAYGGKGLNNSSFMGLTTDKNGNNRNAYCFTPRKYLDPKSNSTIVQSPYYDLRFAEVLLTYAEAVCESGLGDKTKAKQYLNEVRHRAGFKDDVELTLDNVLHEWKVEFPFENRWANVLYRRRGFYNPNSADNREEGNLGKKLTLIPLADISSGKAQYIFLRALPVTSMSKYWGSNPTLSYTGNYYSSIANYKNDKIVDNNRLPE